MGPVGEADVSSKSKRPPRRLNATELGNRYLLLFVWAWVSVCRPAIEDIYAVKAEIVNVSESMRRGLLTEKMIADQLIEEFGLKTDWNRRDRG